jgi:small-conductance mechanosensitive channel
VLQTSLDDFYGSYQVNIYTRQPHGQAALYSELHQHIQTEFARAGVEIMSPHYRATRTGAASTVPPLPAE